jgi:hypothetical protein
MPKIDKSKRMYFENIDISKPNLTIPLRSIYLLSAFILLIYWYNQNIFFRYINFWYTFFWHFFVWYTFFRYFIIIPERYLCDILIFMLTCRSSLSLVVTKWLASTLMSEALLKKPINCVFHSFLPS